MKKNYNLRKGIFLLLSLMAFSYSAHSATRTWIGGATGDWSVAGNWAGGVPGTDDKAVFNSNVTITFNSSPSVGILDISAGTTVTLNIGAANTLTVDGTSPTTSNLIQLNGNSTLEIGTGTLDVIAAGDKPAIQFRAPGGASFKLLAGSTVNVTGGDGFVSQSGATTGTIDNSGIINIVSVANQDGVLLNVATELIVVNNMCAVINLGTSRIKTVVNGSSMITNNGLITFNPTSGASGGILLRAGTGNNVATNNGFYDYSNSANFATGNGGIGTLVDNGVEFKSRNFNRRRY